MSTNKLRPAQEVARELLGDLNLYGSMHLDRITAVIEREREAGARAAIKVIAESAEDIMRQHLDPAAIVRAATTEETLPMTPDELRAGLARAKWLGERLPAMGMDELVIRKGDFLATATFTEKLAARLARVEGDAAGADVALVKILAWVKLFRINCPPPSLSCDLVDAMHAAQDRHSARLAAGAAPEEKATR